MTKPTRPQVSAEDFIITWQQSSSLQEVADKLGIKKEVAYQRARIYKNQYQINLKQFKRKERPRRLNVEKLKNLAEQTLSEVE